MDFGLGIGYSAESIAAPSRSAAVNSLKSGMMAQFRSNFVPASSNSQSQFVQNSSGVQANKRMVLPGFVSGGTIGGDMPAVRINNATGTAPALNNTTPNPGGVAKQTHSER